MSRGETVVGSSNDIDLGRWPGMLEGHLWHTNEALVRYFVQLYKMPLTPVNSLTLVFLIDW